MENAIVDIENENSRYTRTYKLKVVTFIFNTTMLYKL